MAPLADFLLAHVPLPPIPRYLSSYIPGETPLSTTSAVVTTLLSYLAIVFGVQAVMQNKRPRKLTLLFQAHNLFLSSGSLLLLVLMLEETLPRIWYNGIYHAMCHQEAWTAVSPLSCLLATSRLKCVPSEWNFIT
jgi:fatty acid elongase 3